MKLSVLQSELNKGLTRVGKTAQRSTLPITQDVLMSTDEGRLRLVTTNLEQAVTTWIGAKVEQEGGGCIPYKLFSDLVAILPDERIDLELTPSGKSLNVVCGKQKARIAGKDSKEFPAIPVVEGEQVKISGKVFADGITRVAFAAATDESRPVLTGVDMKFKDGMIAMAAADGFRLAVYEAKVDGISKDVHAIIPAKVLPDVAKLVDENLNIEIGQSAVRFDIDHTRIISQVIQGTFPDYRRLIPETSSVRVRMRTADILKAIRTAALFADTGSGIIRMQVSKEGGDHVIIMGKSEEHDNTSELSANIDGGEIKIAFNGKYVSDVLSILESDSVTFEMNNSSSPIKISGDEGYVYVAMPMFVQW